MFKYFINDINRIHKIRYILNAYDYLQRVYSPCEVWSTLYARALFKIRVLFEIPALFGIRNLFEIRPQSSSLSTSIVSTNRTSF